MGSIVIIPILLLGSVLEVSAPLGRSGTSAVNAPAPAALSQYVLGPHDEIALSSIEAEELSGKTLQIDNSGQINVPLAGRVRAAGLTPQQLEAELASRLARYLRRPQVSVSVIQFGSQPVSVIGAVNTPGVHQLRGRRTLVEVLAMAGGVRPEAGHSIKITRRLEYGRIPLKSASDDVEAKFSVAEVSLRAVMEAQNPDDNISVLPYDIISVPTAQMVYVVGEVTKPGGFILNEKESLSVLEALSLAGGLSRTASPNDAKILRASLDNSNREEIDVPVRRILKGKSKDFALHAQDILFIPSSKTKTIAARAAEAAVQTLSGILIWQSAR
jgi:polysaccharide export outer membrane protein